MHTQQSVLGIIRNVTPCPDCKGTGKIIREKCRDCGGTGYTTTRKRLKVKIPAGIDNGQGIRVRGEGEPGTAGGPRGDLIVEVVVRPHPDFRREGKDIYSSVKVPYATMVLGGDISVNTVDGEVSYKVSPGTQSGTRVRIRGQGRTRVGLRLHAVARRPLRDAGSGRPHVAHERAEGRLAHLSGRFGRETQKEGIFRQVSFPERRTQAPDSSAGVGRLPKYPGTCVAVYDAKTTDYTVYGDKCQKKEDNDR